MDDNPSWCSLKVNSFNAMPLKLAAIRASHLRDAPRLSGEHHVPYLFLLNGICNNDVFITSIIYIYILSNIIVLSIVILYHSIILIAMVNNHLCLPLQPCTSTLPSSTASASWPFRQGTTRWKSSHQPPTKAGQSGLPGQWDQW